MKHTIEKLSNGYVLTLTIDTEYLVSAIDEKIEDVRNNTNEQGRAKYMTEVHGNSEELAYADVVVRDLEEIKSKVIGFTKLEDNLRSLIDKMPLKKNGTFKRSVKPTLAEQNYGEYWEDSYGWNILTIRIEADSDTEATVRASYIVEHY